MQKKFARKALAALALAGVVTSGSALANEDWLITAGFAHAPSIHPENNEAALLIPIWFAVPEAFDRDVGGYIRFGMDQSDIFGSRRDDQHIVRVINAGFTLKATDHVIFYAGPGYSYQRAHATNAPTITKHRFNANVGVTLMPGNFGINFSYDSGPNAFGVGFTVSNSWFGGRF